MATTYNDTQIAVIDASGNINVIYPRTKASLVSLTSTSYNDVESCLAALGTAAFKDANSKYTYSDTTTVATTKAVYDAYTALNSSKANASGDTGTVDKSKYLVSREDNCSVSFGWDAKGRLLAYRDVRLVGFVSLY